MTPDGWTWDPTLYAGSAPFYTRGRVAYPAELATLLAGALPTDGTGRLLDVGCGPGSLTLLLAPLFADVVGVDADPDMLAEAARRAETAGVRHAKLRRLRAESLPADVPAPTVVTFAQSFHWTDRPRVAATVRAMLGDGGALVHVGASTHAGTDTGEALPHPRPPRARIDALLRTAEEVRASVYSLSSSAPHLLGDRLGRFDAELRALLPDGPFSERLRGITTDIWR